MWDEYNNHFSGESLICEDCLFQLGLDEYENSYRHRGYHYHYICKR